MVTYRIERLNKEFMRLIADLLMNRVKNETVRAAILTHVDCSRDLSRAKVYFTLIDESMRESVQAALDSVRGALRGQLGREMHIRQIPELHFVFDDSELKARSIDALIDRVIGEDIREGRSAAQGR
jgi:ribosome-binding factor A